MAQQPKMTGWKDDPPPMVGEYNASTCYDRDVLRWWNGRTWSSPYWPHWEDCQKRIRRRMAAQSNISIKWRGLVEKPDYPFPPGPLEKP
jgi:hypothetical protein